MPKFCKTKKDYGLNYNNDEHETYKLIHDKKTGEEKLVLKEKVSITENLSETQAIINAYIELTKQDMENKNAEELLDLMSDEEFVKELEENASNLDDNNIYAVMDRMKEIEHVFNKLPKKEKEKYKTPLNFVQTGLNDFIKDQQTKIKEINKNYITKENKNNIEIKNNNVELENKIKELEEKLKNNIKGETK